MFTTLVVLTVMTILYGLAWHNEPARPRESKSEPGERT